MKDMKKANRFIDELATLCHRYKASICTTDGDTHVWFEFEDGSGEAWSVNLDDMALNESKKQKG